jgi:hypothetical protein
MRGSLILFLCWFQLNAAAGQQRVGSDHDTTKHDRIIIVDPGFATGKPLLLLPPELQSDNGFVLPPTLIPLPTPGTPPPFLLGPVEMKADLTSPLRLQMEREAKLKPWLMVLGTVQAGGAAYAAYRYIKKYGLK